MNTILNKQEDTQTSIQIQKQKEVEYTLLGVGKRPNRNMRLFSLDSDLVVNEVSIVFKKTFDTQKKESKSECYINHDHHHVWALNMKNAQKKFYKFIMENIEK